VIIQRKPVDARNVLNFSQIKSSSSALQADQFQPFLKEYNDVPVCTVLHKLNEQRESTQYLADDSRFSRNLLGGVSAAGVAGGVWAALAGYPIVAAGAAVASLGAGFFSFRSHSNMQKQRAELSLTDNVYKATEKAADDLAASLVTDGPGPDQITDRRYFTSGVITGVATVHSRESGTLLRTQVELGGNVPRKLEANISKKTVSVRSPQGDQSFPGRIELGSQGITVHAEGQQSSNDGPISQSIMPDGTSEVTFSYQRGYTRTLSTDNAKAEKGFQAGTYSWQNGQAASYQSNDTLIVTNPIVPLHDLKPGAVRVLPDGVVGVSSQVNGSYQADEASLPNSRGIGTWSSVSNPNLTTRLVEMSFGKDAFRVTSDLKSGITRVTAADGDHVDSQATLIEINKTYRMQNQHVLGTMEQSLLPKEVLLTLQTGGRTLCVQHKSGQEPRAVEQEDKDFLEDVKSLPITLDDKGTYWVKDGSNQIEMKPMMPLSFLEKEAPAKP
jgi:hypothetical protein